MGTRGLVGYKIDGQYHGQYNHYDSYPSGLGVDVAKLVMMLNKENGWDKLKYNLGKISVIPDMGAIANEELQKRYAEYSEDLMGHEDGEWYQLLRSLQGTGYLLEVYLGKLGHLPENISFIANSLFCEYAYILNLDDMACEFYEGFNKEYDPDSPFNKYWSVDNYEYHPCKKVGEIKFDDPIWERMDLVIGEMERIYKDKEEEVVVVEE